MACRRGVVQSGRHGGLGSSRRKVDGGSEGAEPAGARRKGAWERERERGGCKLAWKQLPDVGGVAGCSWSHARGGVCRSAKWRLWSL